MMTSNNVKTTKMVVEKNESIETIKKHDAFVSKPMMSLLDKTYDIPSPHKTDAKQSRGQKTRKFKCKSIIIDHKPKHLGKDDKTDIIANSRIENVLKTSKHYWEKVSTICSNIENVSLVERTRITENNKTDYNANFRGLNSKTQKSGKKHNKYTKLYDLTELPERSNIYACRTSRSSTAQENHASPLGETVNRPELVNSCVIVMSKRVVDKSSVEPIAPVDITKNKAIKSPDNSLEEKSVALDNKAISENRSVKKSKNQRKKMSKGCSSLDVISNESMSIKSATKENKTNFSDPSKTFNNETRNSGRRRIKYTKLYELTEIPEKCDIHSSFSPISSKVQENYVSPEEETVYRPELVNSCITVMNKRLVVKSSVEPIAPVDTKMNEVTCINAPDNSMEKNSTALGVQSKSENKTAKKSKNQRKKMSKNVHSTLLQTNLSDPSKTFNTETQNAGKRRSRYTKLYELTEIPEKSDIRSCCT